MKDIEEIEEILNCYIDGELDERKSNEVKRLIDNDKEIFNLYDSLKRHKNIMDAIPREPAPQGLCDNITAQLEREILLADTGTYSPKAGRRNLMIRRLMTAAAVLLLAAVLSTVVLDVFLPKSSRDMIANTFRKKPIKQVLYEKPYVEPAVEDKRIAAKTPHEYPFVAILTLKTNNPIEVDWFVAKALTTTNLFNKTTAIDRQAKNVRYSVSCNSRSLSNLIQELSFVWPQCTETKIDIGTEQIGKYITIGNVSAQQAVEICDAQDFSQRTRLAADFGIINKFTSPNILAKSYNSKIIDYDSLIAQKPALTSTEQDATEQPDENNKNATLTIIVTSE